MMMFILLLLVIVMMVQDGAVHAALDGFQLGKATFLGSGCTDGSIRVIKSWNENEKIVWATFSNYSAKTITNSNQLRVRKTCNIVIPIDIPKGMKVGISKVFYRGKTNVPGGSRLQSKPYSKVNAEAFFAGKQGRKIERKFGDNTVGYDGTFSGSSRAPPIYWSNCGASTNFRVNTALTASKPRKQGANVQIEMGVTLFYLTYQKC